LGQGRQDARDFGQKYLIDPVDDDEKSWPERFFRPLEQMGVDDLRLLYGRVIPSFNDALLAASDHVFALYVSQLLSMSQRDYRLEEVGLTGADKDLAQVIMSDFANKWGETAASGLLKYLKLKGTYHDRCEFISAAREGVASLYPNRADAEDFERRSSIVWSTFLKATGGNQHSC
jgi:hypothetical protein